MRRTLRCALVLCISVYLAMMASAAFAQSVVRVLAYPFPPFLNEDLRTGLTPELIELLNVSQNEYHFEIRVVNPQERYGQIHAGLTDMILFESSNWNWQDKSEGVDFSDTLLKGGEVYLTRRSPEKDQSYFDDISKVRIGAYRGYHYAFADYNADEKWLKSRFDIKLAKKHEDIINWVKNGQVDVGVVTLSYLKRYFMMKPQEIEHYLVSQKFAQVYHLKALVRKKAAISMAKFQKILRKVQSGEAFKRFLEDNGIILLWQF